MGIYLTKIQINGKTLAGPNIEAKDFEEADKIALEEYDDMYEVVGELVGEIEYEDYLY